MMQWNTMHLKFLVMDFFNKSDQTRSFLPIWSHLLKKTLMKHLTFCAVLNASLMQIPLGKSDIKLMEYMLMK